MNKHVQSRLASARSSLILAAAAWLLAGAQAGAQPVCSELTSGLQFPLAVTQSNQGNLLVSESGPGTPNSGRISIVDANGNRRTLVAGLPSGLSDVGDPDGPGGLVLRGRTLYVAIGVGDVGVLGALNLVPGDPMKSTVWIRMNSLQGVVVLRAGAGGRPWRLRMLPTVWSLTVYPRLARAPTMRS